MQTPQCVQTVLLSIVSLFMTLRLFTQWRLMKALRLNDYLSILAFLVYIARAVTLYIGLQDSGRLERAERITNWLLILLHTVGTWLIKLSFSVMLYKIVHSRTLTTTIILLAIATTIITIFEFFWTLFMCRPVRKLWVGAEVEGTCHAGTTWGISLLVHGGVLLVVDLALGIVVPIIVLRKLQMRIMLRVSVAVTIAVGTLAGIATIARIYWTHRLFQNPEGSATHVRIWMDVEFGVNIICTAAITFKPLLRRTGILSASFAGARSRSVPTYTDGDPFARVGSNGRGGMHIRVEEEVAIWTEA